MALSSCKQALSFTGRGFAGFSWFRSLEREGRAVYLEERSELRPGVPRGSFQRLLNDFGRGVTA